MNKNIEATTEIIRNLKPYKRTVLNAHDTENDIFHQGQIEGRSQVLYLLLCIGDENVAHDNWHPDRAEILLDARRTILKRLKHDEFKFPVEYPDFETYTYRPG